MDEKYAIGQTVVYRPNFGLGAPTTAKIEDFGEKNGRPLVDLDNGHWAYLTQIIRTIGAT